MPFRARSAAFATVLAGLVFLGAMSQSDPPARAQGALASPNLILVTTDDQAEATLIQETMPVTLQYLRDAGTEFTEAFAAISLCCPSRATMLTGQYPHNNGTYENEYAELDGKGNVLPVWLDRAGYRTIHVGKWLNGYSRVVKSTTPAPGWDQWFTELTARRYYNYALSENGERVEYGDEPRDYLTRVLSRKAAEAVRRASRGSAPFYLQLDHHAPHVSNEKAGGRCEGATPPDPRDRDLFRDTSLPKTPSFNEADVSDKPTSVRSLELLDSEKQAEVLRRYRCALASLRSVDRSLARLIGALERTGELENTAIAFTTDQGLYYGEHRIPTGKAFPYDEGAGVPLFVRLPSSMRGAQPDEVADPVSLVDLAPTFVELADAEPCRDPGHCRTLDGRSLLPRLGGSTGGWPADRGVLIEWKREFDASAKTELSRPDPCAYRVIRTSQHFYAEYSGVLSKPRQCDPGSEIEHYDLNTDEFQLENLGEQELGDPYFGVQNELALRLDRLRTCSGTTGASACE